MIWLDWALLGALAISALAGMRIGLLWTAVAAFSIYVGWLFAGQMSGTASLLVESYTDSTTALAIVQVVIYAALLALILYAAHRTVRALRPLLSAATMGASNLFDRVGGLVVGLLAGAMLAGALVLVGARLTYQIDLNEVDIGVPGQVETRVALGETVQEDLQELLSTSEVAGALVTIATLLPAASFGLAPLQFGDSLELLKETLD